MKWLYCIIPCSHLFPGKVVGTWNIYNYNTAVQLLRQRQGVACTVSIAGWRSVMLLMVGRHLFSGHTRSFAYPHHQAENNQIGAHSLNLWGPVIISSWSRLVQGSEQLSSNPIRKEGCRVWTCTFGRPPALILVNMEFATFRVHQRQCWASSHAWWTLEETWSP